VAVMKGVSVRLRNLGIAVIHFGAPLMKTFKEYTEFVVSVRVFFVHETTSEVYHVVEIG
jgi:hypothetical protein